MNQNFPFILKGIFFSKSWWHDIKLGCSSEEISVIIFLYLIFCFTIKLSIFLSKKAITHLIIRHFPRIKKGSSPAVTQFKILVAMKKLHTRLGSTYFFLVACLWPYLTVIRIYSWFCAQVSHLAVLERSYVMPGIELGWLLHALQAPNHLYYLTSSLIPCYLILGCTRCFSWLILGFLFRGSTLSAAWGYIWC